MWCAAQEIHCGISTCASQWDASVVDDEGSDGLHNRRLDGGQALATQIHIQACANAESRWRDCGQHSQLSDRQGSESSVSHSYTRDISIHLVYKSHDKKVSYFPQANPYL